MNVLVVEDDRELAESISFHLEAAGFVVTLVETGDAALEHAFVNSYDCLVLDINLPDISGFKVCKQIRQEQAALPIIMLTAREALEDRVAGLNTGADDYIIKPVNSAELVARIRAVVRRSSRDVSPIHKIADLVIDPAAQQVSRSEHLIDLTSKEFAVLEFLARHKHEVVTRSMVLESVWGSEFETFSNVIDVYIRNLRKKIDAKSQQPLIHTIRGKGYSLSDQR